MPIGDVIWYFPICADFSNTVPSVGIPSGTPGIAMAGGADTSRLYPAPCDSLVP